MKEFDNMTNPLAVAVTEYIYFPQPVTDKMGKKDIEGIGLRNFLSCRLSFSISRVRVL
jgi:hypothetical protein